LTKEFLEKAELNSDQNLNVCIKEADEESFDI